MRQRVAVFVDGENIGAVQADAIAQIAEERGETVLSRVYGDVERLNGWREAARFTVVHSGTGKNATDLLMSLDALDLALTGRFDTCVIGSSDRDFSHLAVKLRERGLRVVGAGESNAPDHFRTKCTEFVVLGRVKPVAPAIACFPADRVADALDDDIRALVRTHGTADAMLVQVLGTMMKSVHGVGRGGFAGKSLRAYLENRPSLYDVDPRGHGAHVRLRPVATRS